MTIAELFDRHYRKVHSFLCMLCSNRSLADDLAQEAFLRLLKLRAPEGRLQEKYLMRVAYTCWVRYIKRRRPALPLDEAQHAAISATVAEPAVEVEFATALRNSWAEMPDDYRSIVLLVSCMDFTFVDASEILEVPRTTLVSRHQKAIQWMRDHMTRAI